MCKHEGLSCSSVPSTHIKKLDMTIATCNPSPVGSRDRTHNSKKYLEVLKEFCACCVCYMLPTTLEIITDRFILYYFVWGVVYACMCADASTQCTLVQSPEENIGCPPLDFPLHFLLTVSH